ncbi:MAG: hypothetical protein KF744_17555 [Taibaiella sp.]|nr:hypothetical protein [Taibaiella sp.]
MPKLEQKFTIHPIGQGLFYTGVIKQNDTVKFRMIFDCGCLPASSGAHEAEHYRSEVFDKEKELDLLVISHFDADHINHIKTLLKDDVKVKRIVMPFATFEERLFLTARYIYRADKDTDLNTVDFIIDPARALGPNLGDGGELYLIESDPQKPIPPENDEHNFDLSVPENRFLFSFDPRVRRTGQLTPGDVRAFAAKLDTSRSFKVKDTEKGILLTVGSRKVMEFLFYKKDIGPGSEKFFRKVKELFLKKCGVKVEDDNEVIRTKIIEAVKKMKGAMAVKKIFKTAMDELLKEDLSITKTELENPNTTALCMLHRNLKGIFGLLGIDTTDRHWWRHSEIWHHSICRFTIYNKIGILQQRKETEHWHDWRYFDEHYHWNEGFVQFPNALLTSDSYLKAEVDVNAFFLKYKYYTDKFWLFQVPHHGSEKNADKLLLSQMSYRNWNFINYGVNNDYGHPSPALINDIVVTGHSRKMVPVNEFQGTSFGLDVDF